MSTAAKPPEDATVTELRADIASRRAELAASVDALAEKLDVKAKLKARAAGLRPYAVPAAAGLAGVAVLTIVVKRRRS
jgi:hypothetical protein